MTVFLNGRFLPAEQASLSIFDRGFLYGDGLFETVRVFRGRPFLWAEHLARLTQGATRLGLRLPLAADELTGVAGELLRRNGLADATLRLALSRGPGPRGYSPLGADQPTLVLTVHAAPPSDAPDPAPCRLVTAAYRVPCGDPLSTWKTSCKLLNVLARRDAELAGADEALLLNTAGRVAETTGANLFWFDGPALCTPDLAEGALAGVTRGHVLALARNLGWIVRETAALPSAVAAAEAVFLTNCSLGLREVVELDATPLGRDPRLGVLRAAYHDSIRRLLCD